MKILFVFLALCVVGLKANQDVIVNVKLSNQYEFFDINGTIHLSMFKPGGVKHDLQSASSEQLVPGLHYTLKTNEGFDIEDIEKVKFSYLNNQPNIFRKDEKQEIYLESVTITLYRFRSLIRVQWAPEDESQPIKSSQEIDLVQVPVSV